MPSVNRHLYFQKYLLRYESCFMRLQRYNVDTLCHTVHQMMRLSASSINKSITGSTSAEGIAQRSFCLFVAYSNKYYD